jgi:hypothetical protein
MDIEPPKRGTPVHPEMASQPGKVSTVQVSISPAVEPQIGGTSTPIHHSPQQGGGFHNSQDVQYTFLGPHALHNDREVCHERDDMEHQSEILFHSLQHLTGSDPRAQRGPVTWTAISSKVTWNGAKDTCKDFKNMIEGHLNQCGMAYAHDEAFLKEYKTGG